MYSQPTHVQHIHRFSPGGAARICSARAPTRACAPRSKRGTAANPMLRGGRWYIPTRDCLQRRCCVGVPLPSSAPPPLAVGWAIYQPPAWGRPASRTRDPSSLTSRCHPTPPPPTLHARSLPPRPLFFVRAAPVNVTTSGASPSTSRGTPPLLCATPLPRHRPPPPRARPDGGPAVDTLLPRGTVDHPELASTPPPRRRALPTPPPRHRLHNSVAVSAAAPCSPTLRSCLARALLVETAARGA